LGYDAQVRAAGGRFSTAYQTFKQKCHKIRRRRYIGVTNGSRSASHCHVFVGVEVAPRPNGQPFLPWRRRLLPLVSRTAPVSVGLSIHPSGDIQRFIIGKPE
jgi:hypothetical protein